MFKMLYILNTTNKVNGFSKACMLAAQKCGIEFHIVGNWGYKSEKEKEYDEEKYGIKIYQVDFQRNPLSLRNINAYKQLKSIMALNNYDIVHCNTPTGGVLGRICALRCNTSKVLYQAHGFHFYKNAPILNWIVYYPIERFFSHITDVLITINSEDNLLSNKFKLKENGWREYVPGVGIETDVFIKSKNNIQNKRAELEIDDKDIVLVAVGRLDKNKNISTLIKALSILNDTKFHLLLCGDGDESNNLKELAKELNIEKQIHFLGFRSDVGSILQCSDIYVMSSYREGLSRSIMEAMACELPCVVSGIRGNVDLIGNKNGGFLCNPDDPNDFAVSIKKIQKMNLYESMGRYNREQLKKFELINVVEKFEEIYAKVINLL